MSQSSPLSPPPLPPPTTRHPCVFLDLPLRTPQQICFPLMGMTVYLLHSASGLCWFSGCGSYLTELSVLSPRYVLLNIDDVTPMSRRWQTASMLWRDLCMQGGGDELRKNGEACRLSKLPKTPRLRSTSYHKKAATALCGSFLVFKVRIQLSVLLHVPPVVSGAQLLVGTVL